MASAITKRSKDQALQATGAQPADGCNESRAEGREQAGRIRYGKARWPGAAIEVVK